MRRTFVDFGLLSAEDVETERVFAFGHKGACLAVVHLHDGEDRAEDFFGHERVWPRIGQWSSLLSVIPR